MILNKQVQDVVQYFKNMFHIDGSTAKKALEQSSKLNENIRETQSQLDQINGIEPFLFGMIVTLVVVVLLYMIVSSLAGWYIHVIVIVSILFGIYIANLNPTTVNSS
jgi:mannose/fructose/N-acetylgalactosamine-specific phosphotransferase system component IID